MSMLTGGSSAAGRCPICLGPPTEPYVTPCRHVFCYQCLRTHLASHRNCPQCQMFTTPENIVPAFLAQPTGSPPQAAVAASSAAGPTTPAAATAESPRATPPTAPLARTAGTPNAPTDAPAAAGVQTDDFTPDLTDARSSRRLSPPPMQRRTDARPVSPAHALKRRAVAQAFESELRGVGGPGGRLGSPRSSLSRHGSVAPSAASVLPGPAFPRPAPTFESPTSGGTGVPMQQSLAALLANDDLDPDQIAQLIAVLEQKKKDRTGGQRAVRNTLLLDFLTKTRAERENIIARLSVEVEALSTDIEGLERERAKAGFSALRVPPGNSRAMSDGPAEPDASSRSPDELPGVLAKRKRVDKNYSALKDHYFATVGASSGEARTHSLRKFTDDIMKVTQYSRFRCHSSLLHVARYPDAPGSDVFKASNIVSSIEFDRESKYIATAGVTKRIKIFEVPPAESRVDEVHYPVKEISARAKLSWVCWNPYIRQQLVSSDYEGFVTLWDVNRGTPLNEYEEHEKRAWSVDFCDADPRVFASGSDDGRVKVWTTAQSQSAVTIENGRANICSVKFQPESMFNLAFGSADYHVHYYDLRYPGQPLRVFKSHTRTVSYVKFMSPTELVSACVDSTIKLWDLENMELERTFVGHVNDKNFVGLSVTNDYIACGSEQNAIYAYYKAIPQPFAQYRFPNADPLTGAETEDDDESFVSSVCWCPKNPSMLVGANSLGIIKVLNLTDADEDASQNSEDRSTTG